MSAVLRPSTEAALATALREASRAHIAGGGASSRRSPADATTISLAGLTGVVEHRPTDLVATARAGTTLRELAGSLAPHGQRFPLTPTDPDGTGTLGGVFAAGADGLLGTRGWRARDILLGARAVLPDGDCVRVGSSVVKSVAGFDVCKALVGSHGTLAAISEVTFRVEALPEAAATVTRTCESDTDLHAACEAADALALIPRGIVLRDGALSVRLEGPGPAVEHAVTRLAQSGFVRDETDPFALDGVAHLSVRPCSRRPPLAAFADIARRREFVATADAVPQSPLWAAVRAAFDPTGKLAR